MPDAQVNNLFQFNTTNPGFRGQYIKLAANKADKIGLGSNFNNVRSSLPSIRLDQLIYYFCTLHSIYFPETEQTFSIVL